MAERLPPLQPRWRRSVVSIRPWPCEVRLRQLRTDHEFQEVDVHVVAVAGLDTRGLASVSDDPERPGEVPHGVAPTKLVPQAEQIPEPPKGVRVWGLVVTAELADVDLPTHALHVAPRLVETADIFFAPALSLVEQPGVSRRVAFLPAVPPFGTPM